MKAKFVCMGTIAILLAMAFPFAPQSATAPPTYDRCTWTGAVSDDWNTDENWDCVPGDPGPHHVPTPNDAAIIPYNALRPPMIGAPTTAGSVTINGGGRLTLGTGVRVTVNNGFTLDTQGTLLPGTGIITLNGGNWTRNAGSTITPDPGGPWTVEFNLPDEPGAFDEFIYGSESEQTFGNLTVLNASMGTTALGVGENVTVVDISGWITLGKDTRFYVGRAMIKLAGNLNNDGGILDSDATGVTYLHGTQPQVIGGTATSHTFPGSVYIHKTGGGVMIGGGITALDIKGMLAHYAPFFNTGTARTINTEGLTLSQGTMNFDEALTTWNVNGGVTLYPGTTLNPGTTTFNITGPSWTNNGATIGSGNWAANFYMPASGSQTINGSATTQTFHNFGVYNNLMSPLPLLIGGSTTTLNINGSLTIGDSATFDTGTATNINLGGNLTNNGGTLLLGTGTLTFNGTTPQTIGGTSSTTFNNLAVNNPAGVTFGICQIVNGLLGLTSGGINTGVSTLNLGPNATSTGTTDVVGNVRRTQVFSPGVPYSFGNPFVTINFSNPGTLSSVNVNLQKTAPAGLTPAVRRTYTITPSGGGYNGTVRLHYLDSELGTITESHLQLWRYGGGGQSVLEPLAIVWTLQGRTGAVNTTDNWVELSGVTQFSEWALAPDNATTSYLSYLPSILRQ